MCSYQVEIDTWWNVNDNENVVAFEVVEVEIDTWWNVNIVFLN